MLPYGIRNKFRYNYRDYHTRRKYGIVNWWEVELGTGKSKKTERQKAKRITYAIYQNNIS